MDEPPGALDAEMRELMCGELRSLLHVYRPYLHIYNHVRTKEPRQAVGMTYEEWNPLPPEG